MTPNSRSKYIDKQTCEDGDVVDVQQAMNVGLPVVELISVVVGGYDVQKEDVFGLRVQS